MLEILLIYFFFLLRGDKFDLDGEINQLADLSINEPELEAMMFD